MEKTYTVTEEGMRKVAKYYCDQMEDSENQMIPSDTRGELYLCATRVYRTMRRLGLADVFEEYVDEYKEEENNHKNMSYIV